jgi:hypothetical protein
MPVAEALMTKMERSAALEQAGIAGLREILRAASLRLRVPIPLEPIFQERVKKVLKPDLSSKRILRRHAGPTRP